MQPNAIDPAVIPRLRRPRPIADVVQLPGDWALRVSRMPGKALHTAVILASLAATQRTLTVDLSRQAIFRFGLTAPEAHRGLSTLVRAGLVTAHRRQRCAPRVTLLSKALDHATP